MPLMCTSRSRRMGGYLYDVDLYGTTAPPETDRTRLRVLSSELSIRCEVLPDLLEHSRIDQPGVAFRRLLLRIQHELDGPAMRPECAGAKDRETFVDRIALGDALFELEWVDGCHLGIAAEDAHPRKA